MSEEDLIKQVCKEGLASVRKHEKGSRREGGIDGFKLAQTAKNIYDIEKLLEESRHKDAEAMIAVNEEKITSDEYWKQRYITLQLEHVHKVLQVAHPDRFPAPYASGIRQYAKIVGVKS